MPPQNFEAIPESSTSMTMTWTPPAIENQNGVITGYVINITVPNTQETFQLLVAGNTLYIHVDTLVPFTTYVCIIAEHTSVGLGPYSTALIVTTHEDGTDCISDIRFISEYLLVIINEIFIRKMYIQHNYNSKLYHIQ